MNLSRIMILLLMAGFCLNALAGEQERALADIQPQMLPIGQQVFRYDFESLANGPELTPQFTAITEDERHVLEGEASLLADTRGTPWEWNIFLTSPEGLLEGGKRYLLEFKYHLLERTNENSYFYFLFRSDQENEERSYAWKSYVAWEGELSASGTMARRVVLGPYDDYRLQLAIHGEGALVVDDVTVHELTDYPAPETTVEVSEEQDPYEPYGVCFSVNQTWVYESDAEALQALQLMADAGVQWVRMGPSWTHLESVQGTVDQSQLQRTDLVIQRANELGIEVYLLLLGVPKWASKNPDHVRYWAWAPRDMLAYRQHVRMIAERYHQQVKYWEIWNEPDWQFWESPYEEFPKLLRAACTVLKDVDPSCKVILGGLATDGVAGWSSPASTEHALQRLYDAGGKDYFDILAIHPYSYSLETGSWESLDKINTAWSVMHRNGDGDKPIWITELGADTTVMSEQVQAQYLRETYDTLLKHPAVDKLFWYNFRCTGEDPNDNEQNFGLVNHDFSPRPAYVAYSEMPKAVQRSVVPAYLELDPPDLRKPVIIPENMPSFFLPTWDFSSGRSGRTAQSIPGAPKTSGKGPGRTRLTLSR